MRPILPAMRLLSAAVLLTGLGAIAPQDARAATTHTVTIALDDDALTYADFGQLTWGNTVYLTGHLRTNDSSAIRSDSGTIALQALPYGATAWTTVETSTYPSFPDVEPRITTQYRLAYSGGTTTTGEPVAAATSSPITIPVARKVTQTFRGFDTMIYTATPKFGHKRVVVKRFKHGHFVRWFTARTNRTGRFVHSVKIPLNAKYEIRWPTSNGYAGHTSIYCWYGC